MFVYRTKAESAEFTSAIQNFLIQLLFTDLADTSQVGLLVQVSRALMLPSFAHEIIRCARRILNQLKTICAVVDKVGKLQNESEEEEDSSSFSDIDGQATNIWEEKSPPIFDEQGSIKAGTINHLVKTATDETNLDSKFVETFFATFPSFCGPWQLLQKLRERYFDFFFNCFTFFSDITRNLLTLSYKQYNKGLVLAFCFGFKTRLPNGMENSSKKFSDSLMKFKQVGIISWLKKLGLSLKLKSCCCHSKLHQSPYLSALQSLLNLLLPKSFN